MAGGSRSLRRRRIVAVFPAPTVQLIMRGRFRPRFLRVHGVLISLNHVVVDSVFDIGGDRWPAEDPLIVRLIFREQERDIPLAIQIPLTQVGV